MTGSGEQLFYDMSMDIRQAEVAALIFEGEAFVVDAKQVHQGCVEIVHVHAIRLDVVAVFVSNTMGITRLHTSARHQEGKATGVGSPSTSHSGWLLEDL